MEYHIRFIGAFFSLAAASLVASTGAIAAPTFTDVTAASGLGEEPGQTQSLAWGDYDDDGDPDLYLTNAGPNRLLRNDGEAGFVDVTDETGVAGPATPDGAGIGVAFGDLDNDGDLDLYVSQINDGDDQLYRNDGPTGPGGEIAFTNVAQEAGVVVERSARGAALVDYDRDGLLDIYATATGESLLFHNRGDMRFEEVAQDLGVAPAGRDVGVAVTDVNVDGWPDLFVANRTGDPTNLFVNEQGTFSDRAESAGITASGLGMGVVALDYDNDLDMDLYWTTWPGEGIPQGNVFYENEGGLAFSNVTDETGTIDLLGWGISANTADIDNDGWMDLFVANGFDPSTSSSVLYRNRGDGSFEDITETLAGMPADARAVAFADYDSDGDQDIVVAAFDGVTRLWRNDTTNDNHWLQLELNGSRSNHSAVGARVEVRTPLRTTVQEVYGSTGRGNQNAAPLHFGLGAATSVERVRVEWPSGQVQILENLDVDRRITLDEPGAQPVQFSGSWFGGPGQAGHGLNLEAVDARRYVAYWYVFDNDGNHFWLAAEGQRRGKRIDMTAYTTEGGRFPPSFDASETTLVEWGSLRFDFDDCNRGVLRWEPTIEGFDAGSMPIQRLTGLAGLDCG